MGSFSLSIAAYRLQACSRSHSTHSHREIVIIDKANRRFNYDLCAKCEARLSTLLTCKFVCSGSNRERRLPFPFCRRLGFMLGNRLLVSFHLSVANHINWSGAFCRQRRSVLVQSIKWNNKTELIVIGYTQRAITWDSLWALHFKRSHVPYLHDEITFRLRLSGSIGIFTRQSHFACRDWINQAIKLRAVARKRLRKSFIF